MNKGIWYAIGAYLVWGLLPIYWKQLQQVDALQLTSHRVLWSFVLLGTVILCMRQGRAWLAALRTPRVLLTYMAAGVLIGGNWLTYIWGVNAGFLVEISLGYFINPLINVLIGVIVLHERLRPGQWVPIGLATAGVLYLTVVYGSLPWIALTLAFSFGIYGLVKKTAPLGSFQGLTLETAILFLPALGYLAFAESSGHGAFLQAGLWTDALLISTGLVTSIPLLLFAAAAQRIPLSTMGVLQYIAPTLQFLLGVFLYREPFTATQFVGYSIVWLALILFWLEGAWAYRTRATVASS